MNLKLISDNELIFDLKNLVSEERELLTTILRYLREVENRKIYLQKGFPSMFSYVTEELSYSEGAAQRRIQAMRLLKDLPEIESKIQTGEISLSVASQVQSYLRKKEKKAPIKKEEKIALVNSLAGTSSRECERKLIKLSPDTALPREITRPLSFDATLLQLVADKDFMKKLERIKELTSHQNPEGKHVQALSKAMDHCLDIIDPRRREDRRLYKNQKKAQKLKNPLGPGPVRSPGRRGEPDNNQLCAKMPNAQASKSLTNSCGKAPFPQLLVRRTNKPTTTPTQTTKQSPPTSAVKPVNRHIPNPTRDKVYLRDQGQCQHQDKKTGKVCGSKYQVQIDHRFPYSLGGEHSAENLQLRCRWHNLYRAEILTGSKKYWEKSI